MSYSAEQCSGVGAWVRPVQLECQEKIGVLLSHTLPRGINQRLLFSTDDLGQLINNRAVLFPQTLVKIAFFLLNLPCKQQREYLPDQHQFCHIDSMLIENILHVFGLCVYPFFLNHRLLTLPPGSMRLKRLVLAVWGMFLEGPEQPEVSNQGLDWFAPTLSSAVLNTLADFYQAAILPQLPRK
jgi:hypothetical protein